jgi:hypothetical protein
MSRATAPSRDPGRGLRSVRRRRCERCGFLSQGHHHRDRSADRNRHDEANNLNRHAGSAQLVPQQRCTRIDRGGLPGSLRASGLWPMQGSPVPSTGGVPPMLAGSPDMVQAKRGGGAARQNCAPPQPRSLLPRAATLVDRAGETRQRSYGTRASAGQRAGPTRSSLGERASGPGGRVLLRRNIVESGECEPSKPAAQRHCL